MADGKQIGISMTTSSSSSSSSRQAHQPHHRPENSPAADDGAQLAAQLRDRAARCLLRQTQAINNHKQHDNDRTDATFFFFDNHYHAATFTYDDHDTTATRIIENYQTTHAHNYARRAPPPPLIFCTYHSRSRPPNHWAAGSVKRFSQNVFATFYLARTMVFPDCANAQMPRRRCCCCCCCCCCSPLLAASAVTCNLT